MSESNNKSGQDIVPKAAKVGKKNKKNKRPPKEPSVPAVATGKDITLECKTCKEPFVFTAKEQEFYANPERKFSVPKKCKPCRMEDKEKKDQANNK